MMMLLQQDCDHFILLCESMDDAPLPVLDSLGAIADVTRGRLLLLLEPGEMTVSELCLAVELPQSTVSRHLKVLVEGGWVIVRPEGTSRFYSLNPGLSTEARDLWGVVRRPLASTAIAAADSARREAVLAARRSRARDFFRSVAGRWDALRGELFGSTSDILALLSLLDPGLRVGDLGCGTGRVSELLAPLVQRIVAVDASEEMLAMARKRLGGLPNVEVRHGELESLPIADESLDAALLFFVLGYVAEPARVLAECRRVIAPRGRVVIVDLLPHARPEYRSELGQVWLGFSHEQLARWASQAGFKKLEMRPLPRDRSRKQEALFVAVAWESDVGPGEWEACRTGESRVHNGIGVLQ
jgi:ArsR family transcriptional regulator